MVLEENNYYKKFLNGHNGFSKELYLFLKEKGLVIPSFKKLSNKSDGINYELYKIIKANSLNPIHSFRFMQLSKEGEEYWLANAAQGVGKICKITFKVYDEENNPIKNATIRMNSFSAVTDATGTCSLNVDNGTYDLSVGKYGYKAYDNIIIVEDDDYTDTINLPILTTVNDVNTIINNSLNNYYTKPETREYVDEVIGSLEQFHFSIVSKLPEIGVKNTFYLIEESSKDNIIIYKNYLYENGQWCNVGNQIVELSDYYTKDETNTVINTSISYAIAGVTTYEMIVVEKLPEIGEKGFIYLIKENPEDESYIMNVWINNSWVSIGSTAIDLSNYYTIPETQEYVQETINNDLANYYTKADTKTYVLEELGKIVKYKVVTELPDVDNALEGIVYYVDKYPADFNDKPNVYIKVVVGYISEEERPIYAWRRISPDMNNYYTTSQTYSKGEITAKILAEATTTLVIEQVIAYIIKNYDRIKNLLPQLANLGDLINTVRDSLRGEIGNLTDLISHQSTITQDINRALSRGLTNQRNIIENVSNSMAGRLTDVDHDLNTLHDIQARLRNDLGYTNMQLADSIREQLGNFQVFEGTLTELSQKLAKSIIREVVGAAGGAVSGVIGTAIYDNSRYVTGSQLQNELDRLTVEIGNMK